MFKLYSLPPSVPKDHLNSTQTLLEEHQLPHHIQSITDQHESKHLWFFFLLNQAVRFIFGSVCCILFSQTDRSPCHHLIPQTLLWLLPWQQQVLQRSQQQLQVLQLQQRLMGQQGRPSPNKHKRVMLSLATQSGCAKFFKVKLSAIYYPWLLKYQNRQGR